MNKLRGVVGLAEYCVWVVRKIKCLCPRYEKSETSPPENNLYLWILISEASSWALHPLGSDVLWGLHCSGSSPETEPSGYTLAIYYLSVPLSIHPSFSCHLSTSIIYHLSSSSIIYSLSINQNYLCLSIIYLFIYLSSISHLSIIYLFLHLSLIYLSTYQSYAYLSIYLSIIYLFIMSITYMYHLSTNYLSSIYLPAHLPISISTHHSIYQSVSGKAH